MTRACLLIAGLLGAGSCATHAGPSAAAATPAAMRPHENLNAVVWMQTALEYEATAIQAYRLAALQLDAALKDPSWTAAVEQTGDASGRPPAVIVDIDETVLDNSYFQARMVRDNTAFTEESWTRWVEEARATPVPGAVEFTRDARARGIAVFYVTNRMASAEAATRANLAAAGFPLDESQDTVLMRGERPEWQPSAKGPRRAHIARDYRILLLIGDDLGDFVANPAGTLEQRRERTAANTDWWGRRWIMLPNPTYGSWERAVVGGAADPVGAKRRVLRFEPR